METLVPDTERRAAVEADLPKLPLGFFETSVPMPEEWSRFEGAYILLSELYRADATVAASRGWPVVEILGGHLDLVTRPSKLADALISVGAP